MTSRTERERRQTDNDIKSSVVNSDLKSMSEQYMTLAGQIDAGTVLLEQSCSPEISADKVDICRSTASGMLDAGELLEELTGDIKQEVAKRNECSTRGSLFDISGLGGVIDDTSKSLFTLCMEEGPGGTEVAGSRVVDCSIASTLSSLGLDEDTAASRECSSDDINPCLSQMLKVLGSDLISSVESIWSDIESGDLNSTEDETSKNQELLQQFSREDLEAVRANPKDWAGNMLKGMVLTIEEWLKMGVLCEKWEGEAYASECKKPFQAWGCFGRQEEITDICTLGIEGVQLIGETFYTGGVYGALSKIAIDQNPSSAAKIGLDSLKTSPHYKEITTSLANIPYTKNLLSFSKDIQQRGFGEGEHPQRIVYNVTDMLLEGKPMFLAVDILRRAEMPARRQLGNVRKELSDTKKELEEKESESVNNNRREARTRYGGQEGESWMQSARREAATRYGDGGSYSSSGGGGRS